VSANQFSQEGVAVECTALRSSFGEGIVNTLVGDLEIWQGDTLLARAQGTAGLERRVPSGG